MSCWTEESGGDQESETENALYKGVCWAGSFVTCEKKSKDVTKRQQKRNSSYSRDTLELITTLLH